MSSFGGLMDMLFGNLDRDLRRTKIWMEKRWRRKARCHVVSTMLQYLFHRVERDN